VSHRCKTDWYRLNALKLSSATLACAPAVNSRGNASQHGNVRKREMVPGQIDYRQRQKRLTYNALAYFASGMHRS